MTLQDDQKDKGWWRNPMSKRAIWIVVAVAIAVLAFVAIIMITNGIALF